MPSEIFDIEKFVSLSEKAEYWTINKLEDIVKLKLRTKNQLLTLKVMPAKTEEIIKKLKCEIREL